MHIKIEETGGVYIIHPNGEFIKVIGIVVVRMFVIGGRNELQGSTAAVQFEEFLVVPVEDGISKPPSGSLPFSSAKALI